MKNLSKVLFLASFATLAYAADYGIVDFGHCAMESKKGKQEQAGFENLRKQMQQGFEDLNKQFEEVSQKLSDQDYMDGLSPDAEAELKSKHDRLREELMQFQGQSHQILQQSYAKFTQALAEEVNASSEKVAKDKKLIMVINKDQCFYYNPSLDVTSAIIAEMDKRFENTSKAEK